MPAPQPESALSNAQPFTKNRSDPISGNQNRVGHHFFYCYSPSCPCGRPAWHAIPVRKDNQSANIRTSTLAILWKAVASPFPLETQNSPTSLPSTRPGGRRERISGNGRMRGECFWPASDHQRPDKLPGLTWTSRGCGFHPSRRTVLPARPGPATLPVHEASEITLAAG